MDKILKEKMESCSSLFLMPLVQLLIVYSTLSKITALEMQSFTKSSLLSLKQQRHVLLCLFLCCCYGITSHFSM